MNSKIYRFAILLLAFSAILAACSSGPQAVPTNTTDPNAVYTAAAQTADARLTELAQSTPSVTPVPPSATPDLAQTSIAQTAEAAITQLAAMSQTPPAAAATATNPPAASTSGDRATYVSDVTVPDGSDYAPGATFKKTWRIMNAGTTTWSTSYKLVFLSGDQMGTATSVALAENVAPGATVDISVDLTAPSTTGRYRGYWKMQNASGQYFEDAIYVEIDVVGGTVVATATVTPGGPTFTPSPTSSGSAATPTVTATTSAAGAVTDLSMAVDQAVYTGACPHAFTFSATFTVNQASTLTYVLEGGSETSGFSFNLPAAQTSAFNPGTYTLSFPLDFSSSAVGWVRLHISSPVDLTSNQATFSLTCQP